MIQKTCAISGQTFTVTDSDLAFYEKISPTFNGKKYLVPPPTLCPDERQRRRLLQNNERNLYKAQCGCCHKSIITYFPPSLEYTIYCKSCWYSDKWDARDYGRDFDFNRPFFEQFQELREKTPQLYLQVSGELENSDYIHYAGYSKNCYLIAHADFCEDCYYGYGFKKLKDCVDGFYNLHSQHLYDCVYCFNGYELIGCQDCNNCNTSAFLKDCVGCKDCFLCIGLRQAQYCFMNQQLSKEEYEKKRAEIDLGSYAQYQKHKAQLAQAKQKSTVKAFQGVNLQNCSGNYLKNCKNCHHCFDCEDLEDCAYCNQIVLSSKSCYDFYQYGSGAELCYEASTVGDNAFQVLFSHVCHVNCSDLYYCYLMMSCQNCFGCANMHKAKYCILNKQYEKDSYEKMVARIIEHMQETGEWGEFFPAESSPFSYDKTTAQMYYPLDESGAKARGYQWFADPPPVSDATKTVAPDQLPDHIKDVPDEVIQWAIKCEKTEKPFRITPQELKFYRRMKLPLPRRSPDQRHMDRFALRNPRKLWDRQCSDCQKAIQTTYAPERPEKVLCEDCYLKVVN